MGCNDMHCSCRHVRCYAIALAHMFDATQLHLRTCSMLRNCTCAHVGCYAIALAHMFDATQLHLRTCSMLRNCTCAHVRCYAIALAHMLDATQLHLRTCSMLRNCICAHVGCYTIAQSGIMRHVTQHGSKMILYSDGAQSWKCVCTEKKIFNLEVVHGKWEFLRKVKTRKKASGVACAGRQCIDRFWQGLDAFIPANVVNKKQGKLNTRLLTYVYSYMWRYHLPADVNFQMKLGQLAKKTK